MRAIPVLLAALAVAPLFALDVAATDDVECDPYPIGRCGAYDRESVILCWRADAPWGSYPSPTEMNVVDVTIPGDEPLVGTPLAEPRTLAYVWKTPTEALIADPASSALPFESAWEESNSLSGLQRVRAKCGTFMWFDFEESSFWAGPFNVFNRQPDDRIL